MSQEVSYDALPDPPRQENSNPEDPDGWTTWTGTTPAFEEKLRDGLESNDFSTIRTNDLPVAVPHIVKAAQKAPDELLVEAFGFSIMGRNMDLIMEFFERISMKGVDLDGLYPFHLATSYIDGSRTCCDLLDNLVAIMPPQTSILKVHTNELGHTVLDNLMIAILKGHTSCAPGDVEDSWQKQKRCDGEEVDICGRWDADSACLRILLAHGEAAIPFEWKHKFCHTSAQTICHSINSIFYPSYAPEINTPSGIFLKRCLHCGLKLQLLPLHTLVLTALALAQQGTKAEDLFGIMACALCLLSHGVNSSLATQISLVALLRPQEESSDRCSHRELSATELAEQLASLFQNTWSEAIRVGWNLLTYVLHASHEEWKLERSSDDEEMDVGSDSEVADGRSNHGIALTGPPECCDDNYKGNFFGSNAHLGVLHATIQAEMLIYRRLDEGDSWISAHFNMREVWEGLRDRNELRVGLVEKGLLKPFCMCGIFHDDSRFCAGLTHPCASYFMNMEDWSRTTFIQFPERNAE